MNKLDVSVIIPCYNSDKTIIRSLDSVALQTAKPREIILVDDGSDIPIESLVACWDNNNEVPVRVFRQNNLGAPAARNLGIKFAEGSYIAFLDADDIWHPDKLKIQHEVMEKEGLTLTAHAYAFEAKDMPLSPAVSKNNKIHVHRVKKWRFAIGNPFFTPTVMVRKDSFSGFDARFRRVDDYKAWVENFHHGNFGYFDAVLAAGFKRPIGQSGLTGSIDLMHYGYLEVLKTLYREDKISFSFYFIAKLFESIKLPIRRYFSG